MWKGEGIAYFNNKGTTVLCEGTEENTDKPQSGYLVSRQRLGL